MAHLLLVHGFLGSSLNWSPVTSKLSLPLGLMGISIQSVNLLWHAKNAGPTDPSSFNLNTMTENLLSQINIPAGERVIALGHSFGLRPLLRAASLRPGLFKALIVEDSSPELSERGYTLLSKIFREIPVPFSSREVAKARLEEVFGAESQMARFLLANLGPDQNQKQNWRFQAKALQQVLEDSFQEPLWKEWTSFANPIHLIVGGDSYFLSSDRLKKCLESGAEFGRSHSVVAHAGHWVHADQPEIFCDIVQRQIENWTS